MTAKEAEQKVKAAYPMATSRGFQHVGESWKYWIEYASTWQSATFDSEEAAWQNAASRLPASKDVEDAKLSSVEEGEAKEKCLHCSETIERGVGGLWYSASTGSACYENRGGGGHNPVAEPKPTPSTPAKMSTYKGIDILGNPIFEPQPDSSSISTEQTFEGWVDRHVKARDQFGFTYNDLRDCWNAAKSQPKQPMPEQVERIAVYVESESECLMPIVVEETKHDYGVRLLKVMADEIRNKFAAKGQSNGR
jgi:hypothetical protein